MNVLVVYCHPCEDSFNAAVLKVTLEALAERGHDVRVSTSIARGSIRSCGAEWRTLP